MKYRVKISYTVEVEANSDANAAYAACYEAAYNNTTKHLEVKVVSKAVNDPQPEVPATPHQHTDLTVQDDAPIAGVSGVGQGIPVNPESFAPEHEVGDVRDKPEDVGSV